MRVKKLQTIYEYVIHITRKMLYYRVQPFIFRTDRIIDDNIISNTYQFNIISKKLPFAAIGYCARLHIQVLKFFFEKLFNVDLTVFLIASISSNHVPKVLVPKFK